MNHPPRSPENRACPPRTRHHESTTGLNGYATAGHVAGTPTGRRSGSDRRSSSGSPAVGSGLMLAYRGGVWPSALPETGRRQPTALGYAARHPVTTSPTRASHIRHRQGRTSRHRAMTILRKLMNNPFRARRPHLEAAVPRWPVVYDRRRSLSVLLSGTPNFDLGAAGEARRLPTR
jgi:hypothetical protein